MQSQVQSSSPHFTIRQLADSVYAAMAIVGSHAFCNAGLVDLGDTLLVFDSFQSPEAAAAFRLFAEAEFGRPPDLVINSHYHNDHIWGNQAYAPEATMVSTERTRQLIEANCQLEITHYRENWPALLLSERRNLERADTTADRQEAALWVTIYEAIGVALQTLDVQVPTVTFEKHMCLRGRNRNAQLVAFDGPDGGPGPHSGSDAILFLPDDGIVFAADLLFFDFHPYLAEGDPHLLLQALSLLEDLDADIFIPGHGPIGTLREIEMLKQYIEHCFEKAQQISSGGEADAGSNLSLEIPRRFADWKLRRFYRINVEAMRRKL